MLTVTIHSILDERKQELLQSKDKLEKSRLEAEKDWKEAMLRFESNEVNMTAEDK